MNRRIPLLFAALVLTPAAYAGEASELEISPYLFEAADGTEINAELGEIQVRERRSDDHSRLIPLRFVRFRSTSDEPGAPIVYLAGGPGGSGIDTARGSRFPLFMAMREFGDVIALDQRGTGMSGGDELKCHEQYMLPFDEPLARTKAERAMAAAAATCARRLRETGIDPGAYNTRESAADLDQLRRALGADKLTLWGISYGTHLALAALKYHQSSIDRLILAGLEPLDATLKLPADQQALMGKIAVLAANDPEIESALPDLLGAIQAVLEKLRGRPVTVTLTDPGSGTSAPMAVGAYDLQVVLAGMLTGPDFFAAMPDFIARLEDGDWTALALASARLRFGSLPGMMSIAMDCASGASGQRLRQIAGEAKTTLLGDAINMGGAGICDGLGIEDLGDDFRAPVRATVPALLISGTLDGRTPVTNGEAVARELPNARHLIIEGAGHSDPLFLSSPQILATMKDFMRGRTIGDLRIELEDAVEFIPPHRVVTLTPESLRRFVGSYRIQGDDIRRVVAAGDVLYTVRGRGRPLPIRPMSETAFFYEGDASRLEFEADANGEVTAMTMYPGGARSGERALKID